MSKIGSDGQQHFSSGAEGFTPCYQREFRRNESAVIVFQTRVLLQKHGHNQFMEDAGGPLCIGTGKLREAQFFHTLGQQILAAGFQLAQYPPHQDSRKSSRA